MEEALFWSYWKLYLVTEARTRFILAFGIWLSTAWISLVSLPMKLSRNVKISPNTWRHGPGTLGWVKRNRAVGWLTTASAGSHHSPQDRQRPYDTTQNPTSGTPKLEEFKRPKHKVVGGEMSFCYRALFPSLSWKSRSTSCTKNCPHTQLAPIENTATPVIIIGKSALDFLFAMAARFGYGRLRWCRLKKTIEFKP